MGMPFFVLKKLRLLMVECSRLLNFDFLYHSYLSYTRMHQKRGYLWMLIFALAALVLILGLARFYFRYKSFKWSKSGSDQSKWTLMSFHKLGFDEYEILDSLDEDNVIGSGASVKVYKAVLSNGEAVAVKKISRMERKEAEGGEADVEKGAAGFSRDDGFEAEVDTHGKIRHKNIVKLWCCGVARDCKLLVYEYMSMGVWVICCIVAKEGC